MNAEATKIQQARGAALSSFAWPDGTCLRHVTTGQPLAKIFHRMKEECHAKEYEDF